MTAVPAANADNRMKTTALPPIPEWTVVPGYTDIIYSKADEGIAAWTRRDFHVSSGAG